MARTREALMTDGRTEIREAKTYICLPQGETYNSQVSALLKHCIFVNGLSEESLILPRLKQEQVKLQDFFG